MERNKCSIERLALSVMSDIYRDTRAEQRRKIASRLKLLLFSARINTNVPKHWRFLSYVYIYICMYNVKGSYMHHHA